MKKMIFFASGLFFFGLAYLCIPTILNATTIDFNENPDDSYWYTPILSDGFTFTDITLEGSLGTADNLDNSSVNNGTVHLMDWTNNSSLTSVRMEATDGSTFSLFSFDFTSGYLNGSRQATQLSVTGYSDQGIAIANEVFSSNSYSYLNFTTLNVSTDFENLAYVVFDATGLNNRVGYDNIVVNEQPIPEPATFLLFGLGILGIAGVSRKKTA